LASGLVVENFLTVAKEGRWAHIFESVLRSIVVFEVPFWLVKLISMDKVENVSFIVDRKHGLCIKVNNVETWRLALVGGDGTDDEVHSDWLMGYHISDNLILLLMDMRVHAPSNNVLESIGKSMISSTILSCTLIQIWDMSKHNGGSIDFLKL